MRGVATIPACLLPTAQVTGVSVRLSDINVRCPGLAARILPDSNSADAQVMFEIASANEHLFADKSAVDELMRRRECVLNESAHTMSPALIGTGTLEGPLNVKCEGGVANSEETTTHANEFKNTSEK